MDCRRDIDIEREERKKVRGNSYTSSWMSRVERGKVWQMLKAPPLKSSDPHFLVINVIVRPILTISVLNLKSQALLFWGCLFTNFRAFQTYF